MTENNSSGGGFEPFSPVENGYAEWVRCGIENGYFDYYKEYQIQQQQLRLMQEQLFVQHAISHAIDPRLASRPSAIDPRLALRAAPSSAASGFTAPGFTAPSFAVSGFTAPSFAAPSFAAPSSATSSLPFAHGYASVSDVPRPAASGSVASSSAASSSAAPRYAASSSAASSSAASSSTASSSTASSSHGNAHGPIAYGFSSSSGGTRKEIPPNHIFCLRLLDRGKCEHVGCSFSHILPSEFKTKLCDAFLNRKCNQTDAKCCSFAHDTGDLFCLEYNRYQTCKYGNKCRHIHFEFDDTKHTSGSTLKRFRTE